MTARLYSDSNPPQTTRTRRITIRLRQDEYMAIMAYCDDAEITYSQLFIEAIRDHVSLPERTYGHTLEHERKRQASFYQTINDPRRRAHLYQ